MSKHKKQDDGKEKKSTMVFEGHRYLTRRELLGAGLIPAGGWLVLPGIWGMLSKSGIAQAALNCPPASSGSSLPGYININMSGGANLASNVLVTDAGGQVLSDLTNLGMGQGGAGYTLTKAFKNNLQFGAPNGQSLSPTISNLVTQIIAQSQQSNGGNIVSNSVFVSIPVQSQDDTSTNNLSALGMVAADVGNAKLPPLGFENSKTGVGQQPAVLAPPSPLFVSSFKVIQNALGTTGALASLSQSQQLAVFNMVNNLSASQANRLNNFTGGANMSTLVQCAAGQNVTLVQNGAGTIDPGGNATVSGIWGLTAGQTNGPNNNGVNLYTAASIAYNVLQGNAVAGTIEIGGCDYHDGTRSTGDGKDGTCGQIVGMILRTAALLNKKVFIDITADGSTNSGQGETTAGGVWTSDRGTGGIRHIIAYDPAGNVNVNNAGNPASYMIGQFTTGQVADNTFYSGMSPDNSAITAYLNFAAFAHGTSAVLGGTSPAGTVLGSSAPSATDLAKVVKIQS